MMVFSLPSQLSRLRIYLQCRRPRVNSWVGKSPWRRKWQPTRVFLPGESHGQRNLAGYSSWNWQESDMTQQLNHPLLDGIRKSCNSPFCLRLDFANISVVVVMDFANILVVVVMVLCCMLSCSIMSNSLPSHELQPPGFSVPGDSPGKNTEVGCHVLLQGNLSNPGIESRSPALQADSLLSEPPGAWNVPEKSGFVFFFLTPGSWMAQSH